MGIRFQCPNGHRLHVKSQLAGQVGVCPHCQARVLIPTESQGAPAPPSTPDSGASSEIDRSQMLPAAQQPSAPTPTSSEPTPVQSAPPQQATVPLPETPRAVPKAKPVARPVPLTGQPPAEQPPAPAAVEPADAPPPPPAPAPIAWHLQTNTGEQLGPGDHQTLNQWEAAGQLADDAHVWRTGWEAWRPVAEVRSELPLDGAPTPSKEPAESAASKYVSNRKKAAQRQKYLAVILMVLVLVMAIAMTLILSGAFRPSEEGPAAPPPAPEVEEPAPEEPAPEDPAEEEPVEVGEEAQHNAAEDL